jgi:hypothetical protein
MRVPEPLSHETAELLRHEAAIEPVAPELRRRVLARARFSQRVAAAPQVTLGSSKKYVVVAAFGLGCGALAFAAVFTAQREGTPQPSELPMPKPGPAPSATPEPPSTTRELPYPGMASDLDQQGAVGASLVPASETKAPRDRTVDGKPSGNRADDELALLARARQYVAKGNHASAFAVISEHARRFPRGRLSEEREALRVTALSRTGRHSEARRAAAAFVRRFPRSVLAPQMAQRANEKP